MGHKKWNTVLYCTADLGVDHAKYRPGLYCEVCLVETLDK